MNDYLYWLAAVISVGTMIQRIGKFLDFRIGSEGISALKKRARLEKYWSALARQSTERLAFRILLAVEHQFSTIFGRQILSPGNLWRFVIFSASLNCMLAFLTIVAAAPPEFLIPYLGKPKLLMIVALLVALNIPLDLIAYICTRFAIRITRRKPLLAKIAIIVSAVIASYFMAVASTTIGGVVTLSAMANWNLSFESTVKLFHNWLGLAAAHPFTSQMSLNGVNVGFIALGALPSIFILSVTLFFMIFLSTIARWAHNETIVIFGKFLEEKKSFFELMGFLFTALFSLTWVIFWVASWFL